MYVSHKHTYIKLLPKYISRLTQITCFGQLASFKLSTQVAHTQCPVPHITSLADVLTAVNTNKHNKKQGQIKINVQPLTRSFIIIIIPNNCSNICNKDPPTKRPMYVKFKPLSFGGHQILTVYIFSWSFSPARYRCFRP